MRLNATRHIAVGNLNVDFYIYVNEYPKHPSIAYANSVLIDVGGAATNYAYACSKAGCKAKILAHTGILAVKLGVIDKLKRLGIDTSMIIVHDDEPPGMVFILVDSQGRNTMIKISGANRLLRGDEVCDGEEVDVIHFASVSPRVIKRMLLRNCKRSRIISYDPGTYLSPTLLEEIKDVASYTTILSLSLREARRIVDCNNPLEALKYLAKLGCEITVLRLGAKGALCSIGGKVLYVKPYSHGEVIDTTGAGDTFNAYLNTFLAEGYELEDSLAAASIAAGIKVTRRGAQSAPDRSLVEKILREKGNTLVETVRGSLSLP